VAGGTQYVSWLHETDFVRAVSFLLTNELSGPVNLASPNPLPHKEFTFTHPTWPEAARDLVS
jgi:NAD dependent epimerase/dehydratase family enzyme